jgi:sec-independent protein translocase protein TatA
MVAMGSLSIWHWMAFAAIALFVFGGKGKISDIMGDVAKGVKAFKKGIAEDDTAAPAPRTIENRPAAEADVGDKQKVG